MISMTGYGKAEYSGECGEWVVECSSVNRKQLEVVVQLPREFSSLDLRVRQEVAGSLNRGRVAVAIAYTAKSAQLFSTIQKGAAATAYADLISIQQELKLGGEITLDHILRHPAIYANAAPLTDSDSLWEELSVPLQGALQAMIEMRKTEGASVQKELIGYHRTLCAILLRLQELAPQVPLRHRELLLSRLQKSELSRLPDESRLVTEIALFADRCDISEELSRLGSHLSQFSEKLAEQVPVGRTLEFLVQEMFREINTTGAKANDAEISRAVVETKSLLDKIREQLSNVE